MFSVLGAMAHTLGVSVEHVVASGKERERLWPGISYTFTERSYYECV